MTWSGDDGRGTESYRAYRRDYDIRAEGKPSIPGSSDPAFLGDAARYNPEELLVASLSSCHMLWYLHLCAVNGVVVKAYVDEPVGTLLEEADGSGQFAEVLLRPRVRIAGASSRQRALELHAEAHRLCFIARSVNFAVRHEAEVGTEAQA